MKVRAGGGVPDNWRGIDTHVTSKFEVGRFRAWSDRRVFAWFQLRLELRLGVPMGNLSYVG